MTFQVHQVAVIGAGTMGAGIAQAAATAGWKTALTDARQEALPGALTGISRTLEGAVSRGKLTAEDRDAIRGRISPAGSVAEACRNADLVIEAVVEDLSVKRTVLQNAARVVSDSALIATNTSSLSVAALAGGLPHPARFLGLHFFNPVHLMKLVEVVVHPGTDEPAKADALAVVRALKKEPIVVRDSPASPRAAWVSSLGSKRSEWWSKASPARRTSTAPWSWATITPWGRFGSLTWLGWMCVSGSPSTCTRRWGTISTSRPNSCGKWWPKESWVRRADRASIPGLRERRA